MIDATAPCDRAIVLVMAVARLIGVRIVGFGELLRWTKIFVNDFGLRPGFTCVPLVEGSLVREAIAKIAATSSEVIAKSPQKLKRRGQFYGCL